MAIDDDHIAPWPQVVVAFVIVILRDSVILGRVGIVRALIVVIVAVVVAANSSSSKSSERNNDSSGGGLSSST